MLGIAGTAALLGGYWLWFSSQNRKLSEVVKCFDDLQQEAFERPKNLGEVVGIPAPPADLPDDSSFRSAGQFEFAYHIDQCADGDFVHHIVGRGGDSVTPAKLSEAMLLIMRRLVQQFNPAGLEHAIMLHVDVLESGTQHIDFLMRPEQQSALVQTVQNLQQPG